MHLRQGSAVHQMPVIGTCSVSPVCHPVYVSNVFKHRRFPYGRLASMIKYKAEWEGLPVIQLTRHETYGTSSRCSECGSLTRKSGRMLHCESCHIWINRDINACISQAKRGRTRLVRSLLREKGPPVEAVNQSKDGEQMAGSHIPSTGS